MNENAHEYDCGISFDLNAKDISNYIKKVIDGNVIPPNDRVANASNLSGWAYGESLAESCSNRIIREEVVLKFSAIDAEINKACADPQLASLGFMSGMASAEKQGLIVQLYSDSLDDIYYCPRGFRPELIEWDDGVVRNDLRPL